MQPALILHSWRTRPWAEKRMPVKRLATQESDILSIWENSQISGRQAWTGVTLVKQRGWVIFNLVHGIWVWGIWLNLANQCWALGILIRVSVKQEQLRGFQRCGTESSGIMTNVLFGKIPMVATYTNQYGEVSLPWSYLPSSPGFASLPSLPLYFQLLDFSLAVQRLKIRLVREDPTCHRATKPACHNY